MGLPTIKYYKKYFVTFSDLEKLVSYSDDKNLRLLLTNSLYTIKKYFLRSQLTYFILQLTVAILILDVGYKTFSSTQFILLGLFLVVIRIYNSMISNIKVYYTSGMISRGVLNTWLSKISIFFSEKEKKLLNEFSSTFPSYFFNLDILLKSILDFSVLIISVILAKTLIQYKIIGLLLILIIIPTMIIAGKKWRKTARKITRDYLNLKQTNDTLLRNRGLYPTIFNTLSHTLLPLTIILLTKEGINPLIPQATLLASVADYSWRIVNISHEFDITKRVLTKINQRLNATSKKYIINEMGYLKLCKLNEPSENILIQSKSNNSLIVKDFIPMAITNKKRVSHKYNFEFMPGVYQLNGTNGIGKTTFLESLTLPQEVKVEYSKGEVALNGSSFFDQGQSLPAQAGLKDHRKKYIYIGSDAKNPDINKININLYIKYKQIGKFLKTLIKEKKVKYSEGEKAILSICLAYQEATQNGMRLIFVDESISRIYNDKDIPLRKDVIDLIYSLKETKKTIVIVVDHMTKLEKAVQLNMQKKLITKIN